LEDYLPTFKNPEEKRTFMLTTNVPRLVLTMAIPTIAASLVQSLYNMADTFFVSSLGTLATASVGVNFSLEMIINMIGMFLGSGAASYISRLLGAKDDKRAESVFSTTFFTVVGLGVIVMVFGLIFKRNLVTFLGAPDDVVPYSIQYAEYVLYAAPFMATQLVLNQCLRAEGSAIFSMIGILTGALLNIALDPIFIFLCGWGVAGASAATAISKFVSFLILIIPYVRKSTLLHINIKAISFNSRNILEVVKMGQAAFFRNAAQTIATIVLNTFAGHISASALAAVSVANRVTMFPFSICLGFGQGFQPVIGFAWGAKRIDRIRKSYRFAGISAVGGISCLAILIAIFAKPLIGLFTKSDLEMMDLGIFSLRIQCLALPVHAWGMVVNMLCAGLGKAIPALLLSLCRQLWYIPLTPLLIFFFGAYGVASVQAGADFMSLAVSLPIFFYITRKFLKKTPGELQTQV
jgi:Na+-driven multidrug efflux pump